MSPVRPTSLAALLLLPLLAACGNRAETAAPPLPPLPPLTLQPLIGPLKALAVLPAVDDAARRELRELADVALQLVEADPRTAARAERALLEHPAAWSVLEPALLHEQVATRRRAAWLCGRSKQAILQLPLLLRLKYELDPEGVLWVADALQRLGNDTGLAWLDAAIGNQATAEQAGGLAIEACRERGIALSESPTWAEIQTALRKLTARWRQEGTPSRPDAPVCDERHLEARLATHLATTEGTQLRPVDDARYVMNRAGRLSLPLLTRALTASEPYLRTMALQVLTELGPCASSATAAVLPLLGDPLTGSYAVRALGEIGTAEALPHLRARLHVTDLDVRAEAIRALGAQRDEASRPEFTRLLADAGAPLDVRVGAAFALCCLGGDQKAEAYLAEREAKGDYHVPMLTRLRERLAAFAR